MERNSVYYTMGIFEIEIFTGTFPHGKITNLIARFEDLEWARLSFGESLSEKQEEIAVIELLEKAAEKLESVITKANQHRS